MEYTLGLVSLSIFLTGCASTGGFDYIAPLQLPGGTSGYIEKPGWAMHHFAVAAANPLATDAGYQVLQAGGSAIDCRHCRLNGSVPG